MKARTVTALALAGALACGPATAQERAAGLRPAETSVEAGLWDIMDKAEAEAKARGDLNKDPALNAYVKDVMCRVAAAHCRDLRVYVMERPAMNASMAPNGYTEVWTGLLLRAADEAQLAYVLGHELSHFTENHSIEALQADKNRANVALALSVAVAVAGASAAASSASASEAQAIMDATNNTMDLIYLGRVAAYFRFSRANETQADMLGQQKLASAGYDPAAAAETWQALLVETKGSDFKRIREGRTRTSVFSTHPLEADRIAALQAQAKTLKGGDDRGRERHRAAIRPYLAAWLRDELRKRDFGQTLVLIDRLAARGEDLGVLNFYRGEAYRMRRGDGDLVKARAAYLSAVDHPDAPVAVWRELGDIYRRDGEAAAAKNAYQSYLAKAPQAEDAWLVQDSLSSLE